MSNIVHALLSQQANNEPLAHALQVQRAALTVQLADFTPSLEPDKQLRVHAEWAYLKGQLFMVDELLQYLTTPLPITEDDQDV